MMQGPFFDVTLAYLRTASMMAAVKLRLFEVIGTEGGTIADIAQHTGSEPRGIRILCQTMQALGFVHCEGEFVRLTDQTRVLLGDDGTAPLLGTINYLAGPDLVRHIMIDPDRFVRSGGRQEDNVLAVDHEVWDVFARSMVPLARFTAKRLANYLRSKKRQPRRVLDIAAGHGYYGIEIGRAFGDAHVTGLDWPEVVRHAAENARGNGLEDRYRAVGGSAFTVDWDGRYDTILMVNFLHHFGPDEIVALLQKAKEHLEEGGQVHIVDFIPGREGPTEFEALFSFWMLATTPAGDAHSAPALIALAEQAGFRAEDEQLLRPTNQTVISLRSA